MINTNLLKAKIKEKGLTQEDVAIKIGINPATLSHKVNNVKVFSIDEAQKLVFILDLSSNDSQAIFFGNELAKTQEETICQE